MNRLVAIGDGGEAAPPEFMAESRCLRHQPFGYLTQPIAGWHQYRKLGRLCAMRFCGRDPSLSRGWATDAMITYI